MACTPPELVSAPGQQKNSPMYSYIGEFSVQGIMVTVTVVEAAGFSLDATVT